MPMALRAGFAEVDITPEPGVERAGSLRRRIVEAILDPVFAQVLVLESNGTRIGFVSLDLLSIRWSQVDQIRTAAGSLGIPKTNLMVAATHTHSAPAAVSAGDTKRDQRYIEFMLERVAKALREATSSLAPARIAAASCTEGRVSFIRRCIMKDGSVQTHPPAMSPEIRCAEGVIDPELGVLCVKNAEDDVLGFVVNFACHPNHPLRGECISADYPGQLSLALKRAFGDRCVTVFLNGAFGNAHYRNPLDAEYVPDMTRMGNVLADDVRGLLPQMEFADSVSLEAKTTTLKLPLRDIDGPYGLSAKHPQMLGSSDESEKKRIYENAVRKLREKKKEKDYALAEVQALTIGRDTAFVGIPAEYFAELGLRIKMQSQLTCTYVVGAANGMVGYVPTRHAFERGGYETTVSMWSKLAPEAGDMLAEAALDLLGRNPRRTRRIAGGE